jgi:hypothetical protein
VIVNTGLLKHPMNWVIVTLMLVLAGVAGHLVLGYFGVSASEPTPSQPTQQTPTTTPVNLRADGTFQAVSVGQ